MIIDTVNNEAKCKYLDCPPFPIDYRRTLNHVPVMDKVSAPVNHACPHLSETIQKIENLEHYYDTKVQAQGSRTSNSAVQFGSKSAAHDMAVSDVDSVATAPTPKMDMSSHWVPPSSVHKERDDCHFQVLREDGYL
jgi:hypothetical protein